MPLPIIPNNRQRSPHTRTTHPFCSEVAHSVPAPDVPHTGEEAPVLEPWEYNTGTPTHDHSDRHTRRRTSPAACLPPAHGRAAAPAACLVSSRTPSRLCADHTARLALKTGRQGQAILSTKGRYLHGDSRCLLSRPLRPLRRAPKQGRTGHITLVVAPLEQRLYIHPTSSRRAGINHCIPQPEGHTVKLVPGQCLLGLTQVLLRLILLDKRLHHTSQGCSTARSDPSAGVPCSTTRLRAISIPPLTHHFTPQTPRLHRQFSRHLINPGLIAIVIIAH